MSDNEAFFVERRAAAAFKHGILNRYAVVFASKAGLAAGRRVVFLDGYAGPGRYDDGDDGSPLLFMTAARRVDGLRDVTPVFVERDPAHYASLCDALVDVADGRTFKAFPGDIRDVLPRVLDLAQGHALFAFLDPFGTALDREQLRSELLGRPGQAPTEVLLHLSVSTIARTGGLIRKAAREHRELDGKERKTVEHVDRFLGGTWWRAAFQRLAPASSPDTVGAEAAEEVTATEVALHIANAFCTRLAADGRPRAWTPVIMPVRPDAGALPKYVLVLFTRHLHGVWKFADALAGAGLDWQEAVHKLHARRAAVQEDRRRALRDARRPQRETLPGLGLDELGVDAIKEPAPFDRSAHEAQRREQLVAEIAANLTRLLDDVGDFRPIDHTLAVYGTALGQAGEKHVRAAIKQLHRDGRIANTGIGKDFHERPLAPVNR